jgi:AhpD family alkylhydroperoxidase
MGTIADKGTKKAEVHQEIIATFGRVPEWVSKLPEPALLGFWRIMSDFYLADTVIPTKYKELIGIAVSGATRCRYCALFHTEGARLQGATDAEIAEAAAMAGVTMMGSTFLNAQLIDYGQFKKETTEIVAWVRQNMARTGGRREPAQQLHRV